ncbi:MAG: tRNA (guanosine(46)-N7)-methyltransferase TrmB [Verrucomicrobiota bacterium]
MQSDSNQAPKPTGTLIHQVESIVERIELEKIFPNAQPLELELGSGDGSFLAKYAQEHPEHNFIGVERLLGRLRKIDRKGLRAGLTNLRLVRIEASYLLEYLLPKKTVVALHIYFPDPWPKRKHRKNRLINEVFTVLTKEALQEGGTVYLRTDDADYFEQMARVFDANNSFEKTVTPPDLSSVVTDFERNFHLRGVPTLAAAYRLK